MACQRETCLVAGADRPVNADGTTASSREVEEHKAIQHREFAPVQQRNAATRSMGLKIGHRRHAGRDERDRPREKAEDKQHAANQFDQPGSPAHGER